MVELKVVEVGESKYYYIQLVKNGKFYNKFLGTRKPSDTSKQEQALAEDVASGKYDLKSNVVELLEKVQTKFSYLPEVELVRIAKGLGISGIDIYGVATFYSYFKLTKPAEHTIKVCDGTACHVRGSPKIISMIEKAIGVPPGNTTKDNKFAVETVRCLGLCASAPLMMVDDQLYPKLTEDSVKTTLEEIKNGNN